MKILIARHGKSKKRLNERGFPEILGGDYKFDKELAGEGVLHAEELGRLMQEYRIAAFYSSNLIRAIQTATISAGVYGHGFISSVPDARLNERHFGKMSGEFCDETVLRTELFDWMKEPRRIREYQKRIAGFLGVPDTFGTFREYLAHLIYGEKPNIEATNIITINSEFPALGVEPVQEITGRVNDFENSLLQRHGDETVAVVCHGDVIKCWLAKAAAQPERYSPECVARAQEMPNRGLYREIPNRSLFEIVLR